MTVIAFGQYLACLRKEMKWTQAQLAEKVNCAWTTISRIENGHELPCKRLFMEFNRVFESIGIIYDELDMENLFEYRKARKELLKAVQNGRVEEVERKLEKFYNTMEKSTEIEKEEEQYILLAHLIIKRKHGLGDEIFYRELQYIYRLRREVPNVEDIHRLRLSKLEYVVLILMAEVHMSKGALEAAEKILHGLMANKLDKRSPYIREKCKEISVLLAKINLMKGEYDTSNQLLEYVFNEYFDCTDFRTLYHSLITLEELCEKDEDGEGVKIVNEYLQVTQRLMGYMCGKYRIRRDIRRQGL